MRHIEVVYQNDTHAFVDDFSLDDLIRSRMIKRFYRPSEKRWITIGIGPLRSAQKDYCGMERRRSGGFAEMIPLKGRRTPNPCVGQ